jgi:hypothetical protein
VHRSGQFRLHGELLVVLQARRNVWNAIMAYEEGDVGRVEAEVGARKARRGRSRSCAPSVCWGKHDCKLRCDLHS